MQEIPKTYIKKYYLSHYISFFVVINVWKCSLNALLSLQRMLKGENDNFVNKIGSYVMNQRLCCQCKNLNEFRLYGQST